MWPMCFITMVCLWWFDVGYIYGLGKHHGLYITNIITNIITRCITNITTNIITNWFIYLTTVYILLTSLHDGYWSFWVMFLPTQKNQRNWPMSRHHIVPRGQLLQGPRSPRRDQSVLATNFDEKHGKKGDFSRRMVIFIAKMRCFQWTWWFYMHLLLKMVILYEWTSEHGDSHQVRNGDLS
jgi:hypothetical protein